MSLELCNAFLEALALLNDGVNHGTTYTIERLPEAKSLDSALGKYFSAMSTSRVPPQPAEEWQIRTSKISGDSHQVLADVLSRWFFQHEFSPKVVKPMNGENVVQQFLAHLQNLAGKASISKVEVSPPMWYECVWEDIALESHNGRWILHFGFSD